MSDVETIEVRPSAPARRSWLVSPVLMVALLAGITVILAVPTIVRASSGNETGWNDWSPALTFGAMATVGALILFSAVRTSRVTLTPEALTVQRWGSSTTVRRDQPTGGILCLYSGIIDPRAFPLLVMSDGQSTVRLSGTFWGLDDLRTLAAAVGITENPGLHSGAQLESAVPGALHWYERHPLLFALALIAGTLAVTGVFRLLA